MNDLEKNSEKPRINTDETELLENLKRLDEENSNKSTENPTNIKINSGFCLSENILDVLEDKPYVLVDYLFLLAKKATSSEKRELQDLFPINDDDKAISRPVIKAYIEEWVNSNPQYAKFFSEENLLFIRIGVREFSISSALNIIRERESVILKQGGKDA